LNALSLISGLLFLWRNWIFLLLSASFLALYGQDVKDDRTNIFKKSESMKIKRKLEVEIPVRADLYRLFGLGTLSKDLSFAIILPDKPDKLPKGIRDDDLWYELFSNLINKKNTMATIAGHYEERLDKQSEMMVRDNRDIEEDRFFHKVTKIYDKLTGKEEKEGTKKSKE